MVLYKVSCIKQFCCTYQAEDTQEIFYKVKAFFLSEVIKAEGKEHKEN